MVIEWLAGDGSDRCYYRVKARELSKSLVLMQLSGTDAQALRDGGYDWVKIATLLHDRGVFVPRVIAAIPEHAALVIEDYGDVMLEGVVFAKAAAGDFASVRTYYRACQEMIAKFLAIPASPTAVWCRRSFDAERLAWELKFFQQHYLDAVLHLKLTATQEQAFTQESRALATALAGAARFFVHRDFHSRNIMVYGDQLAVIDFQDARLGPAAYDLVSLCFDAYVPFTSATRRQLLDEGLAAIHRNLGADVFAEANELWRPMALQRQLKAIGSFGYLTLAKQRGDYLRYVGPALKAIRDQDLADSRWPFLSGELLDLMQRSLTK